MKSKLQCNNIRSRHYPNERCKNKALIDNDFCAKHLKNPHLFLNNPINNHINNIKSVVKIQRFWKKYKLYFNFKNQGPARNNTSVSNNNTELYTLEPLETLCKIYLFSFADTNKNIWCFDIRTLSFLLSKSKIILNPYTREVLTKEIVKKIKSRIQWLQSKKYEIMYLDNTTFTHEQIWNQKVLDIFSKIDELGYLVNPEWFHEMDTQDHIDFYKKLYNLWNFRLQLSDEEKRLIVPSYKSSKNKLFKTFFDDLQSKDDKYLKKQNLQLIERLVTSSCDKPQRSLGAMYILMGLYYVNSSIADDYPWLAEL
jgi:hypothetical protein